MPSDMELIKELAKEIGVKLKKSDDIDFEFETKAVFQVNSLGYVTHLGLDNLRIKTFPLTILKFNKLVTLSLHENQLNIFPPETEHLTELSVLYLGQNALNTIPPVVMGITSLTELYLTTNSIKTLPPEIKHLSQLTVLSMYDNNLSTLPPEIKYLTELARLDLRHNNINTLPQEIIHLTNLKHLSVADNPLKQPPQEIATAKDNIKRIRNYFEELTAQGEQFVYEAKLILVGEPGAGKTSLAEKLLNSAYKLNPEEPMTKGIDVKTWRFRYTENIRFQCNIWDFGGQEIMHATHRYFLTKRSLYIVVADNRKEDTDFYYWLNILELLSGKSPVLIVQNEKYKYKKYVPENILKTFKSVQHVYDVNLANNAGLADLSSAVQQYLRDLEHVGKDPIPRNWVRIREALEAEAKKQNYIVYKDYLEICRHNGIEDEEKAGYISEFLHDLGVILHFQRDRILRNTIILNTRWATEAVYQILFDNTIVGDGGEFDNSDLGRAWHEEQYRDKYGELLQLMLNFELCYEIGTTQKYIIPELLPEKSAADKDYWGGEEAKEKGLLRFEYRYDFIPKAIISRMIVRLNRYIYNRLQWKSGVELRIGDSRAIIVEYFNQGVLKIRIAGPDRLETLAILRKEVKELHDSYENLIPHEMVPCNCPECIEKEEPHFFDYEELRQYKQEAEKHIKCRVGRIKDVEVLSLISDVIIDEDERMKDERGKGIHFAPRIYVEGAKAEAKAKAVSESKATATVDIKIDLPAIQDDYAKLKEAIVDVDPGLIEELNRIEDSLDEVSAENDEKDLKKPMNKMRRFLEKVNDENSDYHKAIKGAKKGIEMAQKVGKTYNKFAQWLALPQVPDLFLGS